MLKTETNTLKMRARVMRAARAILRKGKLQADFEHGQWWITDLKTGAQWSVIDCTRPARLKGFSAQTRMVESFDLEQVTQGEGD